MGTFTTIVKLIVALIFIWLIVTPLISVPWSPKPMQNVDGVTYLIGPALFGFARFYLPFEILCLVLTAALFGAVFVAIKEAKT